MMDLSALLMSFISFVSSIGYEGPLFVGLIYLIYSEVSKANTPITPIKTEPQSDVQTDKIIVYYEGNKYDLTRFAKRHPGGKDALLQYNGKDVKDILEETGHSDNAYKILSRCLCKND